MREVVSKSFEFAAGHRVEGQGGHNSNNGKCSRSYHGHNYITRIFVEKDSVNQRKSHHPYVSTNNGEIIAYRGVDDYTTEELKDVERSITEKGFYEPKKGVPNITIQRNPDYGVVLDFGEISKICGEWIENNLDHKTIIWEQDPKTDIVNAMKKDTPNGLYFTKYNPTVENINRELYEKLSELMPKGVKISKIETYETTKCKGELYV